MKVRISLVWKLVLAFLLIALTAAALVAVFIRLTSVGRLTNLILDRYRSRLQEVLTVYYEENGSWVGVDNNWSSLVREALRLQEANPQEAQQELGGMDLRAWRNAFALTNAQGEVIIAMSSVPQGAQVSYRVLQDAAPIVVDQTTVGYLLTARVSPRFSAEEDLFLRRTDLALIYGTLGALVIALILGIILARTLVKPLRALTTASQKIAEGDLAQQVEVNSDDEIGQLAASFNRMSQEVARVNLQRRQMTADIAHDLRTPLTVIGGYIESMRDGVLKPTPERLSLIYREIERLQRLVGDLRMLSQVDAGELPLHPQRVTPRSLLAQAAASFQHPAAQQGILLTVVVEDTLPEVYVDEARMMQVFGNLLANSLRYTPAGGQITLAAGRSNESVVLTVTDTGEGIAPEDLPFIFDRFHRADKSRHSEEDESGLGLAIVKALVEAHHGTIRASSVPGQGTTITLALPPASESQI